MKQFFKDDFVYIIGTICGAIVGKLIYVFMLKDILPAIRITINL